MSERRKGVLWWPRCPNPWLVALVLMKAHISRPSDVFHTIVDMPSLRAVDPLTACKTYHVTPTYVALPGSASCYN